MVSNRDGRLRAFVGDFGLTGKSGGTPIFMAPEGLDKNSRIIGKTDLYSFAITILFLMFPTDLAIELLFLPMPEKLRKLNDSFPLMHLIHNSLLSNAKERFDFESWKIIIEEIKTYDKGWLVDQITTDVLEKRGIDFGPLNEALEKEGGLYFYILGYFGYDIRSSQVNKNAAYNLSTAISQLQKLSFAQSKINIDMLSSGKIFQSTF